MNEHPEHLIIAADRRSTNVEIFGKKLTVLLSGDIYQRSEAQGIEREPQIHLGLKVAEMEKRGIQTNYGDEYRRIEQRNRELALAQVEQQRVTQQIRQLEIEEWKEQERQRRIWNIMRASLSAWCNTSGNL